MIKVFCDICEKEITGDEAYNRLKTRSGMLLTEVLTAVDGVWNGGHVCHACIRKAVIGGEVMEK